jgi:gamma-glutamyltranspeptidase
MEHLAALIAAGSTAANAAVALRRSITVVRAKARNLGTPFQMIAADGHGTATGMTVEVPKF